jgi:hypothetical protein
MGYAILVIKVRTQTILRVLGLFPLAFGMMAFMTQVATRLFGLLRRMNMNRVMLGVAI